MMLSKSACLQHRMAELRDRMTGFLTKSTSLGISLFKNALFQQRMSMSWQCMRGKTIALYRRRYSDGTLQIRLTKDRLPGEKTKIRTLEDFEAMVHIATTNTKHSSTARQVNINPPTRSLFILYPNSQYIRDSLVAQRVKSLPAMRETQI